MTKSSGTILVGGSRPEGRGAGTVPRNTTDGIWVPSYYRRRHPFLWLRAAGGPQTEDWVAGAVVAALVLVLLTLARTPQHEVAPSAAVAEVATTAAQAQDGNVMSADRVAYAPQPSPIDK